MKCERCQRDEEAIARDFGPRSQFDWRTVWCPGSRRAATILCTLCWAELQVWLKHPPARLKDEIFRRVLNARPFVRPMGVSND